MRTGTRVDFDLPGTILSLWKESLSMWVKGLKKLNEKLLVMSILIVLTTKRDIAGLRKSLALIR